MCSINRFFNTTYNDEPEVPPYTGIMFEVTTRAEVVIVKAFELDLRLENATDLTVEIYTLQGSYWDVVGKPENWTLIANTEVVPSMRGGGIVPVQKVVPVRIEAAQRQSFYITMKGAYLDHNVNALQKTGELQSAGEDLDIYVGAGLTDYKFSGQLDKILHPMFAGVIHYEIPYECDTVVTSTAVFEFSVLFRKSVGNRSDVTNAISDALNELLTQDPQLRTYVSDFSLVKQRGETVPLQYTQNCPSTWDECPSSYLRTTFDLVHEDALSHGRLLYEIYRSTEKIMEFVQRRTPGIDSIHVGPESVASRFAMTLVGVPNDEKMDEAQQRYFTDTTKRFLGEALRSKGIVFDVEADGQTQRDGRHLVGRFLADPTEDSIVGDRLKVEGIILGGLPGSTRQDEFRFALNDAFDTGSEVYISMLTDGAYLPGALNDNDDYAFFEQILGVSTQFSVLVEEPTEMQGESSKSGIGAIIAGAIAGIAVLGAVLCFYKHRKEHKRHKCEAEQYRKQMKDERRNRRLAKENSTLSKDWRDHSNDEPRQESVLRSICSTNTSSGSLAAPQSPTPVVGDHEPFPGGGDEKTAKTSDSLMSKHMLRELPQDFRTPRPRIDSSASEGKTQSPITVKTTQSTPRSCSLQSPHCDDTLANLRDLQTLIEVSHLRSVPERHIDNSAGSTRNDASLSRLSSTPTHKRKIVASKSNPEMVVNLNQGHIPSPLPPLRMGLASSVGTRTPQRPTISQRQIGSPAGTQRIDAPLSTLPWTPTPQRKIVASKSNPQTVVDMHQAYLPSPPPRLRLSSASSFGTRTPQRSVQVVRGPTTSQLHMGISAGSQKNDASLSRLSSTPTPKRKVATFKSNPEMIAAARTLHQASPAPPRRLGRVRSAGTMGVSPLPSRSVSAVRCVSSGPKAKQTYPNIQKVDRPTVQRASSDHPQSIHSHQNKAYPTRSQSSAARRPNSLGDIVPPLK